MKTKKLLRSPLAFALLALAPLAAGCGVFDFEIDQPVPEQKVQGSVFGAVFGTLVPSPFPLSIDFAQETKAHGTGPVKAAGLKTLTFNITATSMPSGDTDDFSFVQTVDIFIESTMANTMLQKQKIADLPTAPGAVQQLDLHTYPDVNLLPYINEGSRISSTATGSVPPDDVSFNGKITVHVNTF